MPAAYMAMKRKFESKGEPAKQAKSRASAIYVSQGKTKAARSRRARLLRSE